jgi:hypothetical protein
MNRLVRLLVVFLVASEVTSCVAPYPGPVVAGRRRGGVAGAAIGGAANGWEGAAAGALIGGAAGGMVGRARRSYYTGTPYYAPTARRAYYGGYRRYRY